MPGVTREATRERVFRFGGATTEAGPDLVGVLAEPASGAPRAASQPDVLLLGSGTLHRTGAGRLHVRIARALGEAGLASLRFDFSGVGDSEGRVDDIPRVESSVQETGQAMDALAAARGSERFVLVGHSSGADTAFRRALEDPRVIGLIQLDAPAYRTWRSRRNCWIRRALDPGSWKEAVVRAVRSRRTRETAAAGTGGGEATAGFPPGIAGDFPPREEVARGLLRLLERKTELFYFFSGAHQEHFNYRDQYEDAFREIDFGGRLRVEYLEQSDRRVTDFRHQEYLVKSILEWIGEKFPPRARLEDFPAVARRLFPALREPAIGRTGFE